MTVKEFLEGFQPANPTSATPGSPSLLETMQDVTEIWSNNACRGYFLWAARAVCLSGQQIKDMLAAYEDAFETISVDEAAKIYERG